MSSLIHEPAVFALGERAPVPIRQKAWEEGGAGKFAYKPTLRLLLLVALKRWKQNNNEEEINFFK